MHDNNDSIHFDSPRTWCRLLQLGNKLSTLKNRLKMALEPFGMDYGKESILHKQDQVELLED